MAAVFCWCLLINHKKEPEGTPFKVIPGHDIADLKEKVKEKKPHDLDGIDPDRLRVWRCTTQNRMAFKDVHGNMWESALKSVDFDNGNVVEQLDERDMIANLHVLNEEILLVQMPGVSPPSLTKQESYLEIELLHAGRLHHCTFLFICTDLVISTP